LLLQSAAFVANSAPLACADNRYASILDSMMRILGKAGSHAPHQQQQQYRRPG
jgi:hypothetical protein